ncbi:MAG: VWA domain-containing protein [Alphaproteobacteria bacterium]|nr:VWA domain-containing protein [Alphaproteobacteria bacterium]
MMSLAYPWFGLLVLLPLLIWLIWPTAAKMYGDALRVPFVADLAEIKNQTSGKLQILGGKASFSTLKMVLAALMWLCAVVALCRPQWVGEPHPVQNQGRDIMLVVDISTSMNEADFVLQGKRYDRLTAVKYVVNQFVDKRTEDRIGLVLFGTRAYLQVPLTYDRAALKEVLWATDAGMAGNSTSIGDAVGVALKNMPLQDEVQNKVIVLLTDGENNDGALSILQAVNLAKTEKVKVYTIGVGSDETAFFGGLFSVPKNAELDEAGLQKLAQETKGTYFRAKDLNSLVQVYDAIDQLEPQTSQGRFVQETKDLFYIPAAIALVLFLCLIGLARKEW